MSALYTPVSASRRILLMVLALVAVLSTPVSAQVMQRARNIAVEQQIRQLGLMFFSYAADNNGAYPTGKSSTEIFQKLLDGGYATDPSVFYFQMPGKTAPNGKLKPENVCFDLTITVDNNSSDLVPLIMTTGYRITYKAGSSAVPVSDAVKQAGGIAIFYKGNNATFLRAGPDGSVPSVISNDYTDTAKYQQLTPAGPVPAAQ